MADTPHITVFTTSWCAFCRAEKQFLDAHNIAYEAVDVEADPAASEKMVHLSGQLGVPVTLIDRGNDRQVVVIGFDQARLESELKIAGTSQ